MLLLTLAGCGGGGGGGGNGGGGGASATPSGTAEGAYFGTLSDGRQHYSLVLENGQFYTLYGSSSANIFAVNGFLQGNGNSNNGSFSATDVKDAAANGSVSAATLSASYIAGSSLNGSLTEGANVVTFTGTPIPNTIYVYNAAASLGSIAGTWNLTSLRGFPVTLNIAAAGTFTATSSGCAFTGTIKPRSSGKNVFDVSLTYGGAPCILAGASLSGIAISYTIGTGQQELAIAAIDQARTGTSAFFGAR